MATPTIDPLYDPAPKGQSQLWDYVHVLLCRRRLLIEKQNPNVLNFQGVTKERGGSDISYDSQKREVEAALQVLDGLMFRSKQTDVASEPESTNIRVVRTPLNYSWSEPGSRIITVTCCSHCFGRYYGHFLWPVPRQARRQVPRSLPAPG